MPQATHLPTDFAPATVSFDARNILIVGADTDLGHAIARDLSAGGASLILQTSKQRGVAKLYDELVASECEAPLIAEINLAKAEPDHLAVLADGLTESIKRLDGLIYLDTPSSSLAPVGLTEEQQVASALEQGVMRPLRLLKALLPLLQRAKAPALVFQTWTAGRIAKPYWLSNGTACAALENLATTLAAEQDDFRVSTIDFGKVASALRHRAYPGEARSTLRECNDRSILNSVRYLLDASDGERLTVPDREVSA